MTSRDGALSPAQGRAGHGSQEEMQRRAEWWARAPLLHFLLGPVPLLVSKPRDGSWMCSGSKQVGLRGRWQQSSGREREHKHFLIPFQLFPLHSQQFKKQQIFGEKGLSTVTIFNIVFKMCPPQHVPGNIAVFSPSCHLQTLLAQDQILLCFPNGEDQSWPTPRAQTGSPHFKKKKKKGNIHSSKRLVPLPFGGDNDPRRTMERLPKTASPWKLFHAAFPCGEL